MATGAVHLLHHLPKLVARVTQQWATLKYGVRLLIMVIPHTFGGRLNFNSHLHVLVSAGGLQESEGRWITDLAFDKEKLMPMWRFAVITFLREALLAKALTSNPSKVELRTVLRTQYERWWSIHIDHFESKKHFLLYAGRYVRRPPIAQYRFTKVTDREVRFWTKDKILKRRVNVSYTPQEFVATLAEQVPNRYNMRFATSGYWRPVQRLGPLPLCFCCGTTEALSPKTIELGVFAAQRLWSGSPHRSPRPSDALDWPAGSSRQGALHATTVDSAKARIGVVRQMY